MLSIPGGRSTDTSRPHEQSAAGRGSLSVSRDQGLPGEEVLVALNRAAMSARLMSGAVHEVNNALQVIAGSVELLEQQSALPPAVVKSLDRIRRQGERAATALAELQHFTKAPLDVGGRFNLREAVAHAIALRRYAAARAGLTIELRSDDQSLDIAVGNAGRLQQAVLNLLVNAEQAMSDTPGPITVTIRREAGRIGVEVADTGRGLSDQAAARLFEPFAAGGAASDGAGLGLWATRAIAASFGGSVDVTSTPAGTSVVVWLPAG